jgi:hypothetical protein
MNNLLATAVAQINLRQVVREEDAEFHLSEHERPFSNKTAHLRDILHSILPTDIFLINVIWRHWPIIANPFGQDSQLHKKLFPEEIDKSRTLVIVTEEQAYVDNFQAKYLDQIVENIRILANQSNYIGSGAQKPSVSAARLILGNIPEKSPVEYYQERANAAGNKTIKNLDSPRAKQFRSLIDLLGKDPG